MFWEYNIFTVIPTLKNIGKEPANFLGKFLFKNAEMIWIYLLNKTIIQIQWHRDKHWRKLVIIVRIQRTFFLYPLKEIFLFSFLLWRSYCVI